MVPPSAGSGWAAVEDPPSAERSLSHHRGSPDPQIQVWVLEVLPDLVLDLALV